ncbi:hypothetical protein [Vulcanisaeta distributa]|uniref:Uncharacterized protein n=1 Tax=Vulcanisaeta distributa (strain DSM 14429 / JCM 11212 / NBRC 100878 / IC-017) TaxID=572478 RepID=E1QTQ2_VULDI|nr:hypothetical protein [Vulcanisaeta distributa]ADN50969.1 hypothetical protein Vdis_1588 [Vulcanisaeta distributa DSM 14429]
MINKNEFTKYVVITILMAITVVTITSPASQNTMQVNVTIQGIGPLRNASVTYMEFVQSYTTQMLHAYGMTTTNNEGIAVIPQPPPPLPGKEDVITITINATINGSPIFKSYTFYLTNGNFTNQINITIPMPRANNVNYNNQSMLLIAIIIVIIVVLIAIIIVLMGRSRK